MTNKNCYESDLRNILTDKEVQLYIDELDRLQNEMRMLNKDKRNNPSSELDRKYASKSMLEGKLEYYKTMIALATVEQLKEAHKYDESCADIKINNSDGTSARESVLTKLLDYYYKKKVENIIPYLH